MESLYVHLFLNHIPLVGGMGALMLLSWGIARRSADVTNAALVAVIVVAAAAVPIFITGNQAGEDLAAALPHGLLEQHRDAAIASMVGLAAGAAIAAAALFCWATTKRYPLFAAVATLMVGIAATLLVARTAALGGQLRHVELRPAIEARR
jgi:uncharacterized membrane protein